MCTHMQEVCVHVTRAGGGGGGEVTGGWSEFTSLKYVEGCKERATPHKPDEFHL